MNKIARTQSYGGTTIEDLVTKFCVTTNPVTRSVYKEIINHRLSNAQRSGKLL